MAAGASLPIFPGVNIIGQIPESIREIALTFNLGCINALNQPYDKDLAWVDAIAGVTPAVFEGRIPIDLTVLDGFEPFEGTRRFKQIEVHALKATVHPWERSAQWPLRFDQSGNPVLTGIFNTGSMAARMVQEARRMKARLAATVIREGTPGQNKAKVYDGTTIPGAGLSLFNTAHLVNPLDPGSATFSNYHAAAGAFSESTFQTTRENMRAIPSPTSSWDTLGAQVTDIIGPTQMEEKFRKLAYQQLILQTSTIGSPATAVAGAGVTNIYAANITPCRFWIAPQLDKDPFMVSNPTADLWIAACTSITGAHFVEMVAPTEAFAPVVQLFGPGSEMAAQTRQVHLIADLDAGAAAGLPHVVARYESV